MSREKSSSCPDQAINGVLLLVVCPLVHGFLSLWIRHARRDGLSVTGQSGGRYTCRRMDGWPYAGNHHTQVTYVLSYTKLISYSALIDSAGTTIDFNAAFGYAWKKNITFFYLRWKSKMFSPWKIIIVTDFSELPEYVNASKMISRSAENARSVHFRILIAHAFQKIIVCSARETTTNVT